MRSETNQMWREFKGEERRKASRRERARFNALRNAAQEGKVTIVRRLGDHGVRLASPDRPECAVDYWPGRGTALVVGTSRSRNGVSVAAVLRMLEEVSR